MEEFVELIRSDHGLILIEYIQGLKMHQEKLVLQESLTKPVEDIRRVAGRVEGMSFVIEAIKEIRKVDA